MSDLKDFNKINDLFDIYSSLLTPKQRKIIVEYYHYDLSLQEISLEENISRSAILDSIETTKKKLYSYEDKLKIDQRRKEIKKILLDNEVDSSIVEKILKELFYGI